MSDAKQCDCCNNLSLTINSLIISAMVPKRGSDDPSIVVYEEWEIDVCKGCVAKHTLREILRKSCKDLKYHQLETVGDA
jgi:hypothetical protein